MSELSVKVAREHRFGYLTWVGDAEVEMEVCTCGTRTEGTHGEHLAEVTEAAVRETIAADIEALPASPLCPTHYDITSLAGASFMTGVAVGIEAARLTARGEP